MEGRSFRETTDVLRVLRVVAQGLGGDAGWRSRDQPVEEWLQAVGISELARGINSHSRATPAHTAGNTGN